MITTSMKFDGAGTVVNDADGGAVDEGGDEEEQTYCHHD